MSLKNNWRRLILSGHRGFTLIEILVTVVVLSIGLLGLAGLQAVALKFNSTAYQRSQATSLAYDITERMRANATAARAGAYDVNFGFTDPGASNRDLSEWRQALINTLPAGTGRIVRNGNVFQITIQWDDDRDATTPDQLFQTDTQL